MWSWTHQHSFWVQTIKWLEMRISTFYNQPSTSFITYMDGGQVGGEKKQFAIDLDKIPARIEKIAFSLTIHDGEARSHQIGQVQHGFLRFANAATGQEVMRYDLGSGFTVETAIVIGELYRHNGEWKFNAIGSGFAGGLNALCANFGVDVDGGSDPTCTNDFNRSSDSCTDSTTPGARTRTDAFSCEFDQFQQNRIEEEGRHH